MPVGIITVRRRRAELIVSPATVRKLIDDLEAEVNNGGFDQYFFNSAGDGAAATIRALELIGATRTAAIVRSACQKFPGGPPSSDRFARQAVLLGIVSPNSDAFEQEDAEFYRYTDRLTELVEQFERSAEPGPAPDPAG